MSNQLSVIPQGIQLPAYLQGDDVAAEIARSNAAAAGGIKTGGFARISIKGSKFHEKESGETRPYLNPPAAPGQPALPMACLEVVIIAANPNLIKTYYPGEYAEGDDREPTCSSSNGVTPDSHIVQKQAPVCATCPQNQWGSKVSKMSGKDIKACDDSKQLVVLPAMDLNYKALGLTVTKSALTDWGKYVKALTERGYPVNAIVTNLTFDHTAAYPKLQFTFNRFLSPDDYAKAKERAGGDDVSLIAKPADRPLALPAPVQAAAAPAPAPFIPPVQPTPAPAPAPTGFGAIPPGYGTQSAPTPVAAPAPAEPPKRTRRTRAQIEADNAAAAAQATPSAPAQVDPFAGQPPHVRVAVNSLGGLGTPAGDAMFKTLTGTAPAKVIVADSGADTVVALVPVQPTPAPTPAPVGFGGAAPAASATVTASAASLKDKLSKILNLNRSVAQ